MSVSSKTFECTEAYIGYDDKYLYMAFIANDNPADIRVSLQERDRIFRDDFIGIILDTYQSSAWAYELFVNPIGIQGDLRWTNGGNEDEALDILFESKGIITETGYQVEIAIPFSSLRFPDKQIQSWDFTVLRIQPRETRRQICWTENDRNNSCWPCQFGTMTGIRDIRPGSSLQLLPSLVGSQSGELQNPKSNFQNGRAKGEVGLSVRYPFSSNLSAEATFNPDFSQVESDQALIDVNSSFRLFYPERRTFFSEGADLYQTWINAVYSRSISNPIGAVKLTGGFEHTNFGFLSALDEETPVIVPLEERSLYGITGKSVTSIARVRHSFGDGSNFGGIFTDRHYYGGGFSTNGGFDGMYRFSEDTQLEGQFLGSTTQEPNLPGVLSSTETFNRGKYTANLDGEKFSGYASYLGLKKYERNFMMELTTWMMSPGFRAETGFEPRADQRKLNLWSVYKLFTNGEIVEDWQAGFNTGRIWNFEGAIKDGWFIPLIDFHLKGQTNVHFEYLFSGELYGGIYFDGIRRFSGSFGTQFSELFQGDGYFAVGRSISRNTDIPVLGKLLSGGFSFTIKPLDRLNIQQSIDYSRLDYPTGGNIFDGSVLRTRVNYQHSRELSARIVLQYDSFNHDVSLEPLVSYKLNPFSIFYVGSTNRWHNFNEEEIPGSTEHYENVYHQSLRTFFFKFQYLFQV
ncbi:MAG: carbohydrate binding family 9 domain-containing protein [Ignavibacteriae bacterium]|nr:carbohydrate binding family 9 domain-containing protein [Ignavibacteriota bacterium]